MSTAGMNIHVHMELYPVFQGGGSCLTSPLRYLRDSQLFPKLYYISWSLECKFLLYKSDLLSDRSWRQEHVGWEVL